MGNQNHIQKYNQFAFIQSQWFYIARTPQKIDIYRHSLTQQQVEVYTLQHLTKQKIKFYQWRKQQYKNTKNIIQILHIQLIENKVNNYLCKNQNQFNVKIILQRTPYNIKDFYKLNKTSSDFLQQILLGFQILFRDFGAFYINQQMIRFSKDGTTKVWFNYKLSQNIFLDRNNSLQINQQAMIKSIINICQKIKNFHFNLNLFLFKRKFEQCLYACRKLKQKIINKSQLKTEEITVSNKAQMRKTFPTIPKKIIFFYNSTQNQRLNSQKSIIKQNYTQKKLSKYNLNISVQTPQISSNIRRPPFNQSKTSKNITIQNYTNNNFGLLSENKRQNDKNKNKYQKIIKNNIYIKNAEHQQDWEGGQQRKKDGYDNRNGIYKDGLIYNNNVMNNKLTLNEIMYEILDENKNGNKKLEIIQEIISNDDRNNIIQVCRQIKQAILYKPNLYLKIKSAPQNILQILKNQQNISTSHHKFQKNQHLHQSISSNINQQNVFSTRIKSRTIIQVPDKYNIDNIDPIKPIKRVYSKHYTQQEEKLQDNYKNIDSKRELSGFSKRQTINKIRQILSYQKTKRKQREKKIEQFSQETQIRLTKIIQKQQKQYKNYVSELQKIIELKKKPNRVKQQKLNKTQISKYKYHNNQTQNDNNVSYEDLRADLRNVIQNTNEMEQIKKLKKQKQCQQSIQEKIKKKKSNFAKLKQQAAQVLGI